MLIYTSIVVCLLIYHIVFFIEFSSSVNVWIKFQVLIYESDHDGLINHLGSIFGILDPRRGGSSIWFHSVTHLFQKLAHYLLRWGSVIWIGFLVSNVPLLSFEISFPFFPLTTFESTFVTHLVRQGRGREPSLGITGPNSSLLFFCPQPFTPCVRYLRYNAGACGFVG